MNYQKIHNQIIERAKSENRIKTKNGVYYEKHHIIPKCMGGGDDESNLVLLTGREHFLIHWLLARIFFKNESIWYAFNMMCNRNIKNGYSSIAYKEAKERNSVSVRNSKLGKKGRKMQDWHKEVIRKIHKNKIVSKETRLKQSLARKGIGRPHYEETKIKLSLNSGKTSAVIQFDLKNNYIKEWKSISEAHRAGFKGAISACCRNLRKTASNHIWKYKKDYVQKN